MLSQEEADALIGTEKEIEEEGMELPPPGQTRTFNARSKDGRERFQIDIERGRLDKDKWKMQLRYLGTEILVRLDIVGPAHPNPRNAPSRRLSEYEGRRIPTPHIQQYVEGFGDAWAVPPPPQFTQLDDIAVTWGEFLKYCNIAVFPATQGSF